METNNSNLAILKIIRILEKKPSHGREIARKTGFSHTFVNKILSLYYKKGCLNKEKIGKSINYSIKKNFLTKQILIMGKKLRIIEIMEKNKEFKIIIEEIMEKIDKLLKKIDCIILFGSYADLNYRENSDIDLFFITKLPKKKIEEKTRIIEEKYGKEINIKVSKLEDFVNNKKETLIKETLKGIPLYNSDIFYNIKWK